MPTNIISFAKVLPDDFYEYIREGKRLPVLRLDQEEKALVGDLRYETSDYDGTRRTDCYYPLDPVRFNYYELVAPDDSGNPVFLLLRDEPVLLMVLTSGFEGFGTSVTALKQDINDMMGFLGGGYVLTEFDLSVFEKLDDAW